MATSQLVSLDALYKGWANFSLAAIRLPDGKIIKREIEDHGAAVAVLPYDPERNTVVLVEQLRGPALVALGQETTLEAIAGCLEHDDTETEARREAMEEAGLRLRVLERVASCWTMPGVSTERLTLYLAAYSSADRVDDGGGLAHEDENIRVVEMSASDLATLIANGELVDLKTMALAQALMLRRPDLFI